MSNLRRKLKQRYKEQKRREAAKLKAEEEVHIIVGKESEAVRFIKEAEQPHILAEKEVEASKTIANLIKRKANEQAVSRIDRSFEIQLQDISASFNGEEAEVARLKAEAKEHAKIEEYFAQLKTEEDATLSIKLETERNFPQEDNEATAI